MDNRDSDFGWRRRLGSFRAAFGKLKEAVDLSRRRPLSDLEQLGLIKRFDFTWKLAWKVMRDYLSYQGFPSIEGPGDAIRQSFQSGLIADEAVWVESIAGRKLSARAYEAETAEALAALIKGPYVKMLGRFSEEMARRERAAMEPWPQGEGLA